MKSRMFPGKIVLALSPVQTIIGVLGKVVLLHYTSVYCACLSCSLPFVSFKIKPDGHLVGKELVIPLFVCVVGKMF